MRSSTECEACGQCAERNESGVRSLMANGAQRIGAGFTEPGQTAVTVTPCFPSSSDRDSENRIIQDPEPQIVVTELADSSVNLLVRCWTKRSDFWPVKCDLTKNIKENFEIQGIEIPYPQRTVHSSSS